MHSTALLARTVRESTAETRVYDSASAAARSLSQATARTNATPESGGDIVRSWWPHHRQANASRLTPHATRPEARLGPVARASDPKTPCSEDRSESFAPGSTPHRSNPPVTRRSRSRLDVACSVGRNHRRGPTPAEPDPRRLPDARRGATPRWPAARLPRRSGPCPWRRSRSACTGPPGCRWLRPESTRLRPFAKLA